MTSPSISIGGRTVGGEAAPYVIAELSANHQGSLTLALSLMEEAKRAGADAIKLQTYTPDTMTIDSDRPEFRIEGGLWGGHTLYQLYQTAATPWEWHEALFAEGKKLDLPVFSTPFDASAVEFLEGFDVPAFKIASFELVDLPLIRLVAQTGKPMIISTGMASFDEITEAMNTARQGGAKDILLLHCISGYPTPIAESNLAIINHLQRTFGVPVGLSDHTLGVTAAVAATALGAAAIEKHLTFRRDAGGPDAAFSLEPAELTLLCTACREAWQALGAVDYSRQPSEKRNLVFRRSLFAVADIAAGEPFTAANVRIIRPGHGLAPRYLPKVLGRRAARAIGRGEPLNWPMVAKE